MTRLVKRAWVPLVFVIVVAVAAFTVSRLHGVFGSNMYRPDVGNADAIVQFNPKRVLYEIFGPAGTGQRDYNAWLAKITCKRLGSGLDNSAGSAVFLSHNLPRGTDTAKTWQFLAATIATYCPEQQPVLAAVAEPNR
jgi:hypothetical protein